MSDTLSLYDEVTGIKGIGGRKKQILGSMGIRTVEDLLSYFPVRYRDRRTLIPAARASEDRDSLICGELIRIQLRPLSGHRTITECVMRDESAVFSAVFFNMPYLKKNLHTGMKYVMFGRMKIRNGMRVWTNPEMAPLGSERDARGIIPVYRTSPGISTANLTKWIRTALDCTDLSADWICLFLV